MFYVYVLKSIVNADLYVGFSDDLKTRSARHNAKLVKSTKAYTPWKLIYDEAYGDKRDATIREKLLKEHKIKSNLKNQLKPSLE